MINKIIITVFFLMLCGIYISAQTEKDIVPIYWMDDFKDNSNKWLAENGDGYQIAVKQRHLVVDNGSLGAIQSFPNKYTKPKGEKYGIEVRYIIAKNYANGSISLRCGMGNKGKNYISFTINEKVGEYKISVFVGEKGKEKVLAKWKPASFLKKGAYNVLTIERAGDVATFRLNGVILKVIKGISKYWVGDWVALKAGSKMTVMFDAISIYGYHKLTDSERMKYSPLLQKDNNPESFARDFDLWADNVASQNEVSFSDQVSSQEAKQLFINFQPIQLPYAFDYERSQGRDISQYVDSEGQVYVIGELAECSNKKVALIMRRYKKNEADITRFVVHSYGVDGKPSLDSKELAVNVKKNGSFYKLSQWNAYASNNQIILESQTKVNTGSTSKNKITLNKDFCTY